MWIDLLGYVAWFLSPNRFLENFPQVASCRERPLEACPQKTSDEEQRADPGKNFAIPLDTLKMGIIKN